MTTYAVRRKSDGAEVHRYVADSPIEWLGYEFAAHDHDALPDEGDESAEALPAVFGGRRRLTKLEFLALLGHDEFKGVLSAASASIDVAAWVKMIDLATPEPDGTSVDLADARVQAGLAGLEAAAVLPAGTTERVMRG